MKNDEKALIFIITIITVKWTNLSKEKAEKKELMWKNEKNNNFY